MIDINNQAEKENTINEITFTRMCVMCLVDGFNYYMEINSHTLKRELVSLNFHYKRIHQSVMMVVVMVVQGGCVAKTTLYSVYYYFMITKSNSI